MPALVVSLVPLGALAALGGAYASSTIPILAGSALAFFLSRARVGAVETRAFDAALLAIIGGVLLQLAPLPSPVVAWLSPNLDALRNTLRLDSPAPWTPLSLDPDRTRAGLASLASALLLFWAAREVFSRGGIRQAARAMAWGGFAVTMVAFAQRATAPTLLLWHWVPADPGSQPFGPFVNRNHFATWLLMASALTAGYLVAHTTSHGARANSWRLRLRDWLEDGDGLLLSGAVVVMLLGILATLSRAAILGATAALVAGGLLARRQAQGRVTRLTTAVLAMLLAVGVWSNREGLARKFEAVTTAGRAVIWRETLPIVRDFWVAGTGVGTYSMTMLAYQREARDVHFNQAHNESLQVAAEGGLLLVAPCVAALVLAVGLARRRLREDTRPLGWLRVGAAAGLAGVAIQGVFETGLRMPASGLLAALLAAVVLHERGERSGPDSMQ